MPLLVRPACWCIGPIASSSKQHALSRTRSIGHLRSSLSLSLPRPPNCVREPQPRYHPRSRIRPVGDPDPHPHAPAPRASARSRYIRMRNTVPIGFVEQHGACLQSQTRAGVAPAPVRSAPSAPSPLDSSCPISRAEIPSTARLNPPAKFRAASAVPRSAIGSILLRPLSPPCGPSL